MDPPTLFGIALALDRADAEMLRDQLRAAFRAQHHRAPRDVDTDLAEMRALRPGASASTLRTLVADAEPLATGRSDVPEELLIPVTASRALLTAEGRIVLDVLERLGKSDPLVIDRAEVAAAYGRVAEY